MSDTTTKTCEHCHTEIVDRSPAGTKRFCDRTCKKARWRKLNGRDLKPRPPGLCPTLAARLLELQTCENAGIRPPRINQPIGHPEGR